MKNPIGGKNMKAKKKRVPTPAGKKALVVLQEFIDIFTVKGWLNQVLRVKKGDRKYRITCSETGFVAYRINDHHGLSPGIPGWPVCFVTPDRIMDDSALSKFASTEPNVRDWLQSLADNELELI